MTDLNRYKNAYTLLKEIGEMEDKDQRRTAFRRLLASNQPIAMLVQYAFHPDVEFDLPEDRIPDSQWKPNDSIANPRGMWREARKLHHLTTNSTLNKMRKQMLYIKMLETLEPTDAELLISIVGRKMPWKTMNKLFVQAAVPELFPPVEENK